MNRPTAKHNIPVMGPAANVSKGLSPHDPPIFDPSGDLQVWRREIARWVDTIAQAAKKGQDKMYKTVFNTLANHLYDRGLPSASKSFVDEAQASGKINYKQNDQILAVQELVDLLAVEPPIAIVTRLISSFNKVSACVRHKSEDLSAFVSRFRGLAAEHMMHAGVSSNSQVGEILAITLLNNSNLSEETLSNAKMQLVGMAQSKANDPNDPSASLPPSAISKLKDICNEGKEISESTNFQVSEEQEATTLRENIITLRQKMKEFVARLSSALGEDEQEQGEVDITSRLLKPPERPRLNLDDAVTVIRNISFSSTKETISYTRSELENIIGQRINRAMMSVQATAGSRTRPIIVPGSTPTGIQKPGKTKKRRGGLNPNRNSGNEVNPKRSKQGTERDLYCFDCGSKNHIRGSADCRRPSFQTRKLKSEGAYKSSQEDKSEMSDQEDEIRPVQDFQQGSRPGKRNHH